MNQINVKMKPFYDEADQLMASQRKLKDVFEIGIHFRPNNKIFIYKEGSKWKSVTYKQYEEKCFKFADSIEKKLSQIEKGSFVALKATNSPKWAYIFWGLIIAGYKPIMINPITLRKDTIYLLQQSGAKAIVSDKKEDYNLPLLLLEDIAESSKNIENPVWENELAFCTSGTTGKSRIFVYNGFNICNQIYAAWIMPFTNDDICYDKDVRLISIIPFSHIFGFVAIFLWYSFFGRTIVFPVSNAPEDLVSCCKETKISHIFAVPLFWNRVASSFKEAISKESEKKQKLVKNITLLNNGFIAKSEAGLAAFKPIQKVVQKKVLGSHVRFCISGGSAISKDVLETINGLGYPLYNGYGMTEIGVTSVELSPDPSQRNKGSIGKQLTGVEYAYLNGELLVKSGQIHCATLVDGERKPSEIDCNGYFHTGDIASDIDGNFYIRGKSKDVIIGPNGENIYPDEIEILFKDLKNIDNYSVVGVPSKNGDIVSLVLQINQKLDKDSIKKLQEQIYSINTSLPMAMQIQDFLLSTTSLPINPSMKVMRYQLVDDIKNRPETFIRLNSSHVQTFNDFDKDEVSKVSNHVAEIFADILNIPEKDIDRDSHFMIDLGGDSFIYMSIIASVESEFGINIPTDMIGRLNTVNEFTYYILRKKAD